MKIIYPAVFHKDGNSYWVEFPDLEGCTSFGDSLEETLTNAKEALEGYCITSLENKIPLPKASDIEGIKTTTNCFTTLIVGDISHYIGQSKAVKKTLTIPSWLNDMATENGVNFSETLRDALMTKLQMV